VRRDWFGFDCAWRKESVANAKRNKRRLLSTLKRKPL